MKPSVCAVPDESILGAIGRLYQALWRYARGRRGSLSLAVTLLVGAELVRLSLPWLAGAAINAIQRNGMAGLKPAAQYLSELLGMVLVAWLMHGSGRILERNVALHARAAFALDLISRLLRAPLWWHRHEHPIAVAQRSMQGTEALNNFAESQYIYLQSAVQIIGPLIALWLISPWVGVTAIIGMSVIAASSLSFDRVLLKLSDAKNAADRRNAATWSDVLSNFLTVHALRLCSGATSLVRSRLQAIFTPLRKLVFINELKWGVVDVLGTLLWCGLVTLYVLQGAAPAQDTAQVIALGGVFMVYEYARRAENSMSALAADFSMLAGQLSGFRAVRPLLAAPRSAEAEAPLQPTAWQRLELTSVEFAYPDNPIGLQQINLQLCRGRRYALVGASGAGKSTLLMILAGLEMPSSGQLCLDGQRIDSLTLRREACLIPSTAALFEGSVSDNVTPGLTHDVTAVRRALATVGLEDFINGLAEGLNTIVSAGSSRWSAGQQQRLAVTRGLLASRGASLLLLDEPTTHLDKTNAREMMARILSLHTDECVIASIHDLDLLNQFDEVIYVEAGRVIDMGTVTEVAQRNFKLRKLMSRTDTALNAAWAE